VKFSHAPLGLYSPIIFMVTKLIYKLLRIIFKNFVVTIFLTVLFKFSDLTKLLLLDLCVNGPI
jgi:hypothetical protein